MKSNQENLQQLQSRLKKYNKMSRVAVGVTAADMMGLMTMAVVNPEHNNWTGAIAAFMAFSALGAMVAADVISDQIKDVKSKISEIEQAKLNGK